jgi:hypothetical protein
MRVEDVTQGLNNLKFEFRYNKDENKIELIYSFLMGVPEDNGAILDMRPVARVLRMGRKRKGRKPEVDRVFDSPQAAQEATEKAKKLFERELGWAIDKAIQLLFHEVTARAGLEKDRTVVRDRISTAFKQEATERLGVRPGPPLDPDFETNLKAVTDEIEKTSGRRAPNQLIVDQMNLGDVRNLQRRKARLRKSKGGDSISK